MTKLIYSSLLLSTILLSNEQSMFGAGDLNTPNPYGLTSAEKAIVKNKNILVNNEKKIKRTDVVLQDLEDRIDGIESLLEGDSQKLNKVFLNLKKEMQRAENDSQVNKSVQEDNQKLFEMFTNDISDIRNNINTLKESFDKIVILTNDINKNYVTRKEFNKLIKMLETKTVKKQKKPKVSNVSKSKTPKQLMAEVRVMFKKDYFTKALPILNYLIEKNHRPAECNYYKGDIYYYRKQYKDALHYFKTSMMLYDKAKYLPKLLLHSAVSFEKTGDDANAQNFYTTLVEIYPDTKEAKIASKKIKD